MLFHANLCGLSVYCHASARGIGRRKKSLAFFSVFHETRASVRSFLEKNVKNAKNANDMKQGLHLSAVAPRPDSQVLARSLLSLSLSLSLSL
jgi:hypothetical protein